MPTPPMISRLYAVNIVQTHHIPVAIFGNSLYGRDGRPRRLRPASI